MTITRSSHSYVIIIIIYYFIILCNHHCNLFVQSDKTIDLLIPVINKSSSAAHHPLHFTSVECPTLDTAIELLHHCRNRATGCLSKHQQYDDDDDDDEMMDETNK